MSSTRSARVGCESWVETERVRGGGNFSKREDEGGRGGGGYCRVRSRMLGVSEGFSTGLLFI